MRHPDGHYVREHRLVYEQSHNCLLLPWSAVHHIDANRLNNVWYNLQGMMQKKHDSLEQHGKWLGRKHSEETSRMYSIMRKGKTPGNRLGARQSLESRMKMSKAHKGKKLPEEQRKKIGESVRKTLSKRYH